MSYPRPWRVNQVEACATALVGERVKGLTDMKINGGIME